MPTPTTDQTAELDQLAEDHQDHKLRSSPTWGHLIGDYRYADRFEDVSRSAEDAHIEAARALAARAEAIDPAALDDQRRITREMVAWDAGSQVELLGSRTEEYGADPIFGVQSSLGVYVPKLAVPTPEVAEAMVGKFEGVAAYFHAIAERHREGVAHDRTPAQFAVTQTVAQLDRWLATPIDADPLLAVQDPPAGTDAAGWHQRLKAVVQQQVRPAV